MGRLHGHGAGLDQDLYLRRQVRRSEWAFSVRAIVAALMALAACTAFVLGGVVPGTSAALTVRSTTVRSVGAVAGLTSATSGQPTRATGAIQGLPGTGRAFSYGYDLAAEGAYTSTTAPGASAARRVATTVSGALVDVPIMGWGVGNPEVSPGVFDFTQIAKRIAFVQATGGVPVVTLSGAPDWMKGGQAGTTDWSQIDVAPVPSHYADFATLSAAVAQAFPQVTYFVVWKEMKGFWDAPTNSWDAVDYTTMYNDVYLAIKAVRPDARVGGPYVSVQSHSGPASVTRPTPTGAWGTVRPQALAAISYWLSHSTGADFLAVDGTAFTSDAGLTTDPLDSTAKYAATDAWLRRQTALPIVWMESHLLPDPTVATQQQQSALRIAALLQMASSGAGAGLQWNPESAPTWDQGLWAGSDLPGGGQSTELARELPAVLRVLAAPVSLVGGEPPGTLAATGPDGTVTVVMTATTASVTVTPARA